ncbi:MAG: hypothetical protein K6E21_05145, partial [Bacilli bacterium]|nr:hypothetical protein [Bacilli bacterium]
SMGESTFKDKSYNDIYKITIDTDVKPYEKIIISGKDYNDEFLQTNDIVLASFKTQNAFSIPELPSAGSDGVRKASIKMSNFNPDTDVLEGGYITLSMNEADVLVGGTLDVITYTSEETVEYTVFNGTGNVELSNKSKNGFTVKGLEAGTAEIHASIEVDGKLISSKLVLTVIEDREVTYYFANNYQWKSLRVYLWGSKGENAPFPGVMFSAASTKNKDGVNTYSLSFKVYSDGYTNLIISGTDEVHGWSQTKDILCSDMDVNGNMIYITEENWEDFDFVGENKIYKCSYSYGTFEPFGPHVSFEENNKQVITGQTADIPLSSNAEYEIINSDDTVVEVTKGENKITVKGLKEGTATITAKVDDNIKDSITISVVEDYEVYYYFANNYNWSDLHVYMWNDALHTENAPFPGVALGERSFIDGNGDYIYKITFNRYADNYDGFIISGVDSGKEGGCQTENILVSGFGDNNGVRISGWKDGAENVATTSYGFYFYELYLNIASSVEFNVGASVPITVKTNGENVAYQITSGNDVIELQNESDTGVTIKGLSAGTATFTATVTDGTHTVTKTITVNVEADIECTYYFVNEYEWTNIKAYLYVDENNNNQWPGVSMTLLGTDERGKEIYTISFQKYSDGYKGMVINGHDVTKNKDAKTKDIVFNSLDSGKNCISVTGWEDEENLVADYSTSIINDYVLLSDYSIDMKKDVTKNISFVSSKTITIQNTNSSVVQTTLNDGYVTLTALEAGTATITLTVGTGENAVSKSCTVTVTQDEPNYVTYYFANSYLWSDLKVYLWNATESNGDFPGEALTATPVKNSEGHDTYAITFDRNERDWTNCIISGIDGSHGWAKTYDISFAGLDADNTNMVTINETEWTEVDHPSEGQNIYKCTYATGVFAEFVPDVSISDSAKTVKVGSTTEITVTANTNFVVESSDNETVEVTTNGNKISIKGIKEGQATIDVYVDKDGPKEKKVSCVVTVEENVSTAVTYTINSPFPSWYFDQNPKFYVWLWGGEVQGNGIWVECEYINGAFKFSTDVQFTGCKLVRMDPSVENPDWSYKWNESDPLTFNEEHVTSYSGEM